MAELIFQDCGAAYRKNYALVCADLNDFSKRGDGQGFKELFGAMCLFDLFFFMHIALNIKEVNHPWIVDRLKEVEDRNDRTLDLWARGHWKSTAITFGLTMQEILRNPEERIAIFSHKKQIATAFLKRIKETFQGNILLKTIFDHILYAKPETQADKWSEEDGITVKRNGVYLENTLEAWGLVDNMPTSRHYTIRIYDDVVVPASVTTPEMIKKTEDAFRMSHSLEASEGSRMRVIGTRYHFADLYSVLLKDPSWHTRIHPATDNGKMDGKPVLLSSSALEQIKKDDGPYVFNSQRLLNPVADELQEFKEEWIEYYAKLPSRLNKYLIVDPANEKHKKSDYTCMGVIGIDPLGNYYLVDLIRDKLNLPERKDALFRLVEKHPTVKMPVGYEEYGANSDTQYIRECQKTEGINFRILPLGGTILSKEDRERKLIPIFSDHKFFLPYSLMYKGKNLIQEFIQDELLLFPFAPHDDILDMMSRIKDPKLNAKGPVNYQGGIMSEPKVINTWDPYNLEA